MTKIQVPAVMMNAIQHVPAGQRLNAALIGEKAYFLYLEVLRDDYAWKMEEEQCIEEAAALAAQAMIEYFHHS